VRDMLVAYVVSQADDLLGHARANLPEYMVPAVFVPLTELPYGATGKVDRRMLPDPGRIRPEFTPPRTDAERTVAKLMRDVLDVPHIGPHDDFFALGGTSMSAARIVVRLRETFGVDFALRDVFEHRTLGTLAALAETRLLDLISAMSPEQIAAALADQSGQGAPNT
jgi:acyl carrier protein